MKKSKKIQKFKKILKDNKKYIFTVMIFLVAIAVISSACNNSVFARLTHEEELIGGDGFGETVTKLLKGIITNIMNFTAGVMLEPYTLLMLGIALIIFVVLYLIFQVTGISNGILSYPFPDSIVFNRMAFFDPNFINPTRVSDGNAPVSIMQGSISSLYYTFFIIAITIFVIAAMIIGIKLAITSIASERAQYKQALNNWVFGILLLFTVHLLMAGIFAVNEGIVSVAYDVAGEIEFSLPVFSGVPLVR